MTTSPTAPITREMCVEWAQNNWHLHDGMGEHREFAAYFAACVEFLRAPLAPAQPSPNEFETYRAFWRKYALGSKLRPSCIVCGRPPVEWPPAIQHAELPDVVVCTPCRDAKEAAPASGDSVDSGLTDQEREAIASAIDSLYNEAGDEKTKADGYTKGTSSHTKYWRRYEVAMAEAATLRALAERSKP